MTLKIDFKMLVEIWVSHKKSNQFKMQILNSTFESS